VRPPRRAPRPVLGPFGLLALAAALAAAAPVAAAVDAADLAAGERIYREGLLPSGEPVRAVVEGDIPVDGTLITCQSCHLRAGIGSSEGTVLTLPTSGGYLNAPYHEGIRLSAEERSRIPAVLDPGPRRPAYTDDDLARALRGGVDPTGRRLDPAMPRYLLGDDDLRPLVAYLRQLSTVLSPGVDRETIAFATVYSDDLPAEQRDAMLLPLERYIADRGARAPYYQKRARSTPFKEKMEIAARVPRLLRWELHGPREGWPAQLEEHYRREPVFALVGGMVSGSWEPVHRFCEQRGLPALLPLTDLPVISGEDWYTLYESKGLYGEGEAAARYVRRTFAGSGGPPPVVVLVERSERAEALARGFAETLRRLGLPEPLRLPLPADGDEAALAREARGAAAGGVVALWAGAGRLPLLERLAGGEDAPRLLLAATGLVGEALGAVPEAARPALRVTWPHRLPARRPLVDAAVKAWLRSRGLPVTDLATAHRVYTLGWLLTDAIMMVGQDFYRDHLLDVIDMGQDRTHTAGLYPRLSFGPGQRYASKGCYLVELGPGPEPAIEASSGWVIH